MKKDELELEYKIVIIISLISAFVVGLVCNLGGFAITGLCLVFLFISCRILYVIKESKKTK